MNRLPSGLHCERMRCIWLCRKSRAISRASCLRLAGESRVSRAASAVSRGCSASFSMSPPVKRIFGFREGGHGTGVTLLGDLHPFSQPEINTDIGGGVIENIDIKGKAATAVIGIGEDIGLVLT
ncbi:hypothetical protein XBKQ1_2360032 [Xenorhabdus bovienii str. kraussei Quebec]|uniref:Uncharacterized protein n=1 Tax=Xenorhabdus bovienii str. kraussei Quebec TaxID=1398203 RepID=A0A077PJN6_XENBV|nr:hypothetical protein XBKQ1_2360032 [Xenorhabdus bovienii str. kraussei Quebec]